MSYAGNSDIQNRLGPTLYVQLTDDVGAGSANEDKVTSARLAAEGEIDSYLGRRHAVPIDVAAHPQTADLLKSIALDLAEYRLHARRPPVPEEVARRRDAAIRWLEKVAAGQAVLPTAGELPTNPATGIGGRVDGLKRVLTRDAMERL